MKKKPSKNRSEKKVIKSRIARNCPGDPLAREDYLNQQDTYRHPTERQQKADNLKEDYLKEDYLHVPQAIGRGKFVKHVSRGRKFRER